MRSMVTRLVVLVILVVSACSLKAGVADAVSDAVSTAEDAQDAQEDVDAQEDAQEDVQEGAREDIQDAQEDAQEGTREDVQGAQENVDIQGDVTSAADVTLVAGRFVTAGGQALCEGMVFALSPEWRVDSCGANEACVRQRTPLREFTARICTAIIEESLRLDLDPGLAVAVMERESGFGRAIFDSRRGAYAVDTDICKLLLSPGRIVSRAPGRKAGTERMTWTYSGDRQNTQVVLVEHEDESGVLVNTCVAGETGLFQLLPHNYARGTVVQATGEVLGGSGSARRERLLDDPVTNVRLGCQELARHRELCPVEEHPYWERWVAAYNVGECSQGVHSHEYARKIMNHYLQACRTGWLRDVDGAIRMVEDVWPECERVEAVLDGWDE